MKPLSERGIELDAEVTVSSVAGALDVTVHARSGPRNSDYAAAVQICLRRLRSLGASLDAVRVASENALIPANADRRLRLVDHQLPLRLDRAGDLEALRLAIGREVQAEGRSIDAGPGGNATKKIVISCSAPDEGWPGGADPEDFLRTGAQAPDDEGPPIDPGEDGARPRVFATLNWGFDPAVWGAVGFASASVRDGLARELRNGGLVLSIATRGEHTPKHLRGLPLNLLRVGSQAVATEELVEPGRWAEHLDRHNGSPKWPYGLPIMAAEAFVDPPHSSSLLPRIDERNLAIHLATHWEELKPDEVDRVLTLQRKPVRKVWRTPRAGFVARLRHRPGPPPGPRGTRLLRADSGPAATYCFMLEGAAALGLPELCTPGALGRSLFKVGYSNDPERRQRELNAYLPHEPSLSWRYYLIMWHADEINAWAMEQQVFTLLQAGGADRFKGEMLTASAELLEFCWTRALVETLRPTMPVQIEI